MNLISQGINFGFSAGDVVSNAGTLVQTVGPYVLLGLAFVVAPLFISLMRNATPSEEELEGEEEE